VAGPGKIFGVNGDPSGSLIPVPVDVRGLQVGGQMTEVIWRFMNMGTGIQEDTVMGGTGMGSDRQTAREFLGRREASGTRLMLESVIYDQTYLEPLADFFCAMDIQLLDTPREVLILGDAAMNDPVTGEPINTSRLQIEVRTSLPNTPHGQWDNHEYVPGDPEGQLPEHVPDSRGCE